MSPLPRKRADFSCSARTGGQTTCRYQYRRVNRVLHIIAVVQLRNDAEVRRYYRRKLADGKPRWKPRER